MTTNFFEIGLDYNDATRWYLGQPATTEGKLLPGAFRDCVRWSDSHPLSVDVMKDGEPASFNHSGNSVYIVATELMNVLRKIINPDLFQGVPVSVIGRAEKYEILNILDEVDCVDEKNSEFSRWTAEDGQPNRIGDYRISLLRIDPARAKWHDLFRAKEWNIALICSDRVKEILEKEGVTGILFKPVVHRE